MTDTPQQARIVGVDAMLAAGWTYTDHESEQVDGKPVRYLAAPTTDAPPVWRALQPVVDEHPELTDRAWRPVDGDCLKRAPMITYLLRQAGLDARTATVWAWVDRDAMLLAWLHQATVVTVEGGRVVVVDAAARMYYLGLPPLWVVDAAVYCTALAVCSGVEVVEVKPSCGM